MPRDADDDFTEGQHQVDNGADPGNPLGITDTFCMCFVHATSPTRMTISISLSCSIICRTWWPLMRHQAGMSCFMPGSVPNTCTRSPLLYWAIASWVRITGIGQNRRRALISYSATDRLL